MSSPDLRNLNAQRICLIKPSALGDVVQTLPLLPILREHFPEAHLAWLVNQEFGNLLEGHPDLNEIIPFNRRGSWREWWGMLSQLRQSRFDLVFDLQGLLRTGLMTLASGAATRVGLESAREGSRLAYTATIPDSGRQVPAHLRYWRVAEALGKGEFRPRTIVTLSRSDQEFVRSKVSRLRGPILAIHAGARWKTKQWPIESFGAVACRAMRRYGFSVLIVGSQGEAPAAERLAHLLARFVRGGDLLNLAGQTTLKQLAGLLQASDLMLSNDSGPMHLAASLGTPVCSVFTCTSPVRSGPPGGQHRLIGSELPCAASYCKVCPNRGPAHLACMEELAVERVWSGLRQLIEQSSGQARSA